MACSDQLIPLIVHRDSDCVQIAKLLDFAQNTDGKGIIVFIDGDQFNPYLFGANDQGCKIIESAPEHVFFVIFTAEDRTALTDGAARRRGTNPDDYKKFLDRPNVWAELRLPKAGEMVDNKIRALSIYLASVRQAGKPLFDRWVVVSNDNAFIMGNRGIDLHKQSQKGNNPAFTTRIFESIENCLKDTCEAKGKLPSVIPLILNDFGRTPPDGWYFDPTDVLCISKDIKSNLHTSLNDVKGHKVTMKTRCEREIGRSQQGWPFKGKTFLKAILKRSAVQIRKRFLARKLSRGGRNTPRSSDVFGRDNPTNPVNLRVYNSGSHNPQKGLKRKLFLTRE